MSERTHFDYLLNAFEAASQSDDPAANGYGAKREALFAYVRSLEVIKDAASVLCDRIRSAPLAPVDA